MNHNPLNHNPLNISDMQQIISKYMDIQSIANIKNTCKMYNDDYQEILIYRNLHYYGVTIGTLNIVKHLPEFNTIDLTQNFCVNRLIIFKMICKKILFENNYKCLMVSSITNLLFLYREHLNIDDWDNFMLNFLNTNINIIKENNRLGLWNSILRLRYHNAGRVYVTFKEDKDKFILLTE